MSCPPDVLNSFLIPKFLQAPVAEFWPIAAGWHCKKAIPVYTRAGMVQRFSSGGCEHERDELFTLLSFFISFIHARVKDCHNFALVFPSTYFLSLLLQLPYVKAVRSCISLSVGSYCSSQTLWSSLLLGTCSDTVGNAIKVICPIVRHIIHSFKHIFFSIIIMCTWKVVKWCVCVCEILSQTERFWHLAHL